MTEPGFHRRLRILHPAEFQRVFADPIRSGNSEFTVLATNNGLDHPRLGLAIAKKRVRRAVDRNRIKRLVRESFRHNKGSLPAIDIVVLAKDAITKRDNRAISASLGKHWQRLAKQCDNSSSC